MDEGKHVWYGFNDKGDPVCITHSELFNMALRGSFSDKFSVGWGCAVSSNGYRLVRGDVIKEAEAMGWDDIANFARKQKGMPITLKKTPACGKSTNT